MSIKFGESNNDIEIIYNPKGNKEKNLKIFGSNFVSNNKDKCVIIYNDKGYELKEYLDEINNNYELNNIIRIKLSGIDNIIDASFMFHQCYSLITLKETIKWNTSKIIKMNNMFQDCSSLI